MSLNDLPSVIETEVVNHAFFKIRKEVLHMQHQEDYNYYVLETRPFAVAIIATTPDGRFLINREYRHPSRTILLGAPGGSTDPDEEHEACAKRELLEETGYIAKRYEKLGQSYPYSGVCHQQTVFYRAYDAEKIASPNLDHAEFIETVLYTKEELQKAIKENPVDGILLAGLYFASIC
ncbi:MAG: NUDIX hydrolase [Chlamydiales bacterium]|nr:NUDIX hydrolase [Chlamydiales bacterium]